MRWIVVLIFCLSFVSAIDAEIDCPKSVGVGEEFVCSVEVFDCDGVWDLKVEVLDGEDTVAEIWDKEKGDWNSAYYYLKKFIEEGDEKKVRLVVEEEGDYDCVLKVRQGSVREFFDFDLDVVAGSGEDEDEKDVGLDEDEKDETIVEEVKPKKTEVLLLNGRVLESDVGGAEIVYESGDSKLVRYLPYLLCLFLVGVVIFLIRDKL